MPIQVAPPLAARLGARARSRSESDRRSRDRSQPRSTVTRGSRRKPSKRCAPSGCSRCSYPSSSAGRARRSPRSRRRSKSSGVTARRPRWSTRCTRSRSRRSFATAAPSGCDDYLAPDRRARAAARVGDDGDRHRRRRPFELVRGRARRRPVPPREGRARHLLRRVGRRGARHRAPHARQPAERSGSRRRAGHAVDARGAIELGHARLPRHVQQRIPPAQPKVTSTRSSPTRTARSRRARCCRRRTSCGRRCGWASPAAPSTTARCHVRAEARRKPGHDAAGRGAARRARWVATRSSASLVRARAVGVRARARRRRRAREHGLRDCA